MGHKRRKDNTPDRGGREAREQPNPGSTRRGPPSQDCRLPGKTAGERSRYTAAAICGFLLLVVALVFGRTLAHGFVNFDDNQYVYDNPHVARGLTGDGLVWAFTSAHASNWHPLTWLSHMLDCQLYDLRPGGHHLSSVLLHAATAILLFLVLWRMTGDLWPSALAAAVFAIHPLRAESVAWVAERKDVLSGLFFMLTLGAYVGYVRRPFSLLRYCAGSGAVCARPHGQADARDAAVCAAAVGLLAAGAHDAGPESPLPTNLRSVPGEGQGEG